MSGQELDSWMLEKEARWQAEEPVRKLEQLKSTRRINYPTIEDQLDMLWHAIDTGQNLKDSDFYIKLKAIKDKYPMPDNTNTGAINV